MPLYEYTCRACGAEVELLVRDSDSAPRCPTCGSTALNRKFSTFSPSVRSAASSSCAGGACSLAGASCAGGGCASGACPLN